MGVAVYTTESEEVSSEASVSYTVNPRPASLHPETLSQKIKSKEEKNHHNTETSHFTKRTLYKIHIFKIYS